MEIVNWGILSTAKIGLEQVIPAIQQAPNCHVRAITSRSASKAKEAANLLDIPHWYESYKSLLADDQIDAIYNPLPNHLHVPYGIDALKAGKHLLCEKPLALDTNEAEKLAKVSESHPNLKVMEAFMYRFHPQWKKAKAMVRNGAIGQLQTVHSFFSYFNDDASNIRNKPHMGGGGLMDIGCYCISLSRYLFDAEPQKVQGQWKIDSQFGTDYLASGMLDFGDGTASFTCATQTAPHQRVNIVGSTGRIVIDIPFNAPPNAETQIQHYRDGKRETITFEPANQYTLQAQAFAASIIEDKPVPTSLNDAIANMKVIDDFRQAANT